jgi:GNAT superfamily N-acetyltransferase
VQRTLRRPQRDCIRNPTYNLMNIYKSTIEERELLDNKLVEFNREKVPFQQSADWIDLSHMLKVETEEAIAGINAMLYCWNILYIDILYVEEAHRGKSYGKILLAKAENEAKQLGGYMSHLDTFDWQAKEFYEHLGYEIFGILENCPRGHKRYYMKKIF